MSVFGSIFAEPFKETRRFNFLTVSTPLDSMPDAVTKLFVTIEKSIFDAMGDRLESGTEDVIIVRAELYENDYPDEEDPYEDATNPVVYIRMRFSRGNGYAHEELSLVDFKAPKGKTGPSYFAGFGRFVLVSALKWLVSEGIIDEYTVVGLYADGQRRGKDPSELYTKIYEPMGFQRAIPQKIAHRMTSTAQGKIMRATVGQIVESYNWSP